jgi:hypothetical protein
MVIAQTVVLILPKEQSKILHNIDSARRGVGPDSPNHAEPVEGRAGGVFATDDPGGRERSADVWIWQRILKR